MEKKIKLLFLFLGWASLVTNAAEVTKHKHLQLQINQNEYRFPWKRSADEMPYESRQKRQIGGPAQEAMQRALTGNRVGQPEFGRPTLNNEYFNNPGNFGGRLGGSAGVKVWESQSGSQSAGIGIAGQANAGLNGGRPFANSPEIGGGLGYRNGAFSATAGVNHGSHTPFHRKPSTSYGVGIRYRF